MVAVHFPIFWRNVGVSINITTDETEEEASDDEETEDTEVTEDAE